MSKLPILWGIYTLACMGDQCRVYHQPSALYLTLTECERINALGHNFSNMVKPSEKIRWECREVDWKRIHE